MISQNWLCAIHEIDFEIQAHFVISQNRFSDITKSILWYHKFNVIFLYHQIEFVESQNALKLPSKKWCLPAPQA